MSRPLLKIGSTGSHVVTVQDCLDIPADGDFGPITADAVAKFQRQESLTADGIVGEQTWTALERVYHLPPYPPPPIQPLPAATQQTIASMASTSKIAKYNWKNRGVAPRGYITGMAIAWSTVARKWTLGDTSAMEMAKANTHNADKDALSWYKAIFDQHGMANEADGIDTLRHLFVMQIGHGMRESSGKHCVGRDQSASNTDAMTCEAGLFSLSWNASSCSSEMQKLYDEYAHSGAVMICAASHFAEGVSCTAAEWQCYGSGAGRDYQRLAKACPQFAIESSAIALRKLRQHFGPINRKEVEIKNEADDLLLSVQNLVFEDAPSV